VRVPRDLSGRELARRLEGCEYRVTRQVGSHLRLTREGDPTHHITVPAHEALKVGTLSGILRAVERHLGKTREELLSDLFG
jgi:predicted RNA binding protein YcfA (HicA-like mRNA interferase family)